MQTRTTDVGTRVIVKQQKQNKLTPTFLQYPYVVTNVKGSMITALNKDTGHTINHEKYVLYITKKKIFLLNLKIFYWEHWFSLLYIFGHSVMVLDIIFFCFSLIFERYCFRFVYFFRGRCDLLLITCTVEVISNIIIVLKSLFWLLGYNSWM